VSAIIRLRWQIHALRAALPLLGIRDCAGVLPHRERQQPNERQQDDQGGISQIFHGCTPFLFLHFDIR
jgi:hypothetical protein